MSPLYLKITAWLCAFLMSLSSSFPWIIRAHYIPDISRNTDVRVVSFNLCCASGPEEKSIPYRSKLVSAQLKEAKPDSMGFQEVNSEWMQHLKNHMPEYGFVCEWRNYYDSESNPIFYLKDKYNLVDSGTFWLSDTPDVVGSKFPYSAYIRICTWVLLEDKATGERYAHFNTHLDNVSDEARIGQLDVLFSKVSEFSDKYPVIITGDLNDVPESEMYNKISATFKDCRKEAPKTSDDVTWIEYGASAKIYDYVFISSKAKANRYGVFEEKINLAYLSDHCGIYADIEFIG